VPTAGYSRNPVRPGPGLIRAATAK